MTQMVAPASAVNAVVDRRQITDQVILFHRLAREAVAADKAMPDSVLILSAFREGFMPLNRHFAIGNMVDMIGAAIELAADRNVYVPLALMRPGRLASNGKGTESDVDCVLGFVVDGDADHGYEAPQPPVPANLVIESSAGNVQTFILLSEALPPSEAKQFGRALKRATRADAADDISHVWRVAGTSNFPGKAKIGRGRPSHPQPVRIVGSLDLTARTDVSTLRAALAEHWQEEPAFDPNAPRAAQQTEHNNDPAKVRALFQKMKDAGVFDRANDDPDDDPREWYTRAAKALSYDLGDVEGFAIWWDCVCWHGDRPDQGIPVDETEANVRWRDCSRLPRNGQPITLGTIKRMLERQFGWKQADMFTGRVKSAQETFAGVQTPPGMTPMGGITPPDAAAAAAWEASKNMTSVRHPMISGDGAMPGPREPRIAPPETAEIEIAERFARAFGSQMSFVATSNTWLYWDGKRWRQDKTKYVFDLARQFCKMESGLYAGAPGAQMSIARAMASDKMVNAVMRLACLDRKIASEQNDWDSDIWLLGTPDGVVDLRSGTLRTATPADRITKSTAVTPAGDCPLFLSVLARACGNDQEMIDYLQRLFGYFLTGSTTEQSFYFLSGFGATSKGTILHAVSGILADYHQETAIETLTQADHDRHPAEVAALQGARLVTCSETEKGKNWAESRIKAWTGGDVIPARFMGGNWFNFIPTFKLAVSGNHQPSLRPDSAMRRRVKLLPFNNIVPESERDPNLGEKLRKEWPGILAWAIAGCVAWQRDGMRTPASIVDATKTYMDQEAADAMVMWIAERCVRDPKVETQTSTLYSSFKTFASNMGERDIGVRQFGKDVRQQEGISGRHTNTGTVIVGLRLKTVAEEAAEFHAKAAAEPAAAPPTGKFKNAPDGTPPPPPVFQGW